MNHKFFNFLVLCLQCGGVYILFILPASSQTLNEWDSYWDSIHYWDASNSGEQYVITKVNYSTFEVTLNRMVGDTEIPLPPIGKTFPNNVRKNADKGTETKNVDL